MGSGRGAAQTARQRYDENLDTIRDVIQFVCAHLHFYRDEREEFASLVHLKLLEDDASTIDKFRGECELRTFLVTVVTRLGLDYRRRRWGKWRPSRTALRLGPIATLMEALIHRDQCTVEEVIEILLTNYQVDASRQEIEELSNQLSFRQRRRPVGMEAMETLPSTAPSPEDAILALEAEENRNRVFTILRSAVKELTAEERMILRLFFVDGFSWKQIGDSLGYAQRSLYTIKNRTLAFLKDRLVACGLAGDLALVALGDVEGDSLWEDP